MSSPRRPPPRRLDRLALMAAVVLTCLLAFATVVPAASANQPGAFSGGMMGAPVHHHRQATGAGMHDFGTSPMMERRSSMPRGGHHDGGLSSAVLAGILAVVVAALAVVVLLVRRPAARGQTPSTS